MMKHASIAILIVLTTLAFVMLVGAQEIDPATLIDVQVSVNPDLQFVRVYAEPDEDSPVNEALFPSVIVRLTGEAEVVGEIRWWQVTPPSGIEGWVAEVTDDLPTLILEDGAPLGSGGQPNAASVPTRATAVASIPMDATQVVAVDLLLIYTNPDTEADILEAVSRGIELSVLDADTESEWVQIESPSGVVGWVEMTVDGLPTLINAAAANGELAVGGVGIIRSTGLVLLYSEPDDESQVVEALSGGVSLQIIGGPEIISDVNWWQVRSPSAIDGWLAEIVEGEVVFFSPSAIAALIPTATPTQLPTQVALATATPIPTPLICPGAPSPRFVVGAIGFVMPGPSNRVRQSPDLSSPQVGELDAGVRFTVIGGPICANNYRWWQVEYAGGTGWTADGTGNTPWLDVISLPPTATAASSLTSPSIPGTVGVGAEVQVQSLEPAFPLRASPSLSGAVIVNVPRSARATVIAGPELVSETNERGATTGFFWWQIRTSEGREGWMPEATFGEPVLVMYRANGPVAPVMCTLSTIRDVSIRSGPGTQYEQIASRAGEGQLLAAEGQFGDITVPEAHWWRLAEGFWVRNDQVREQPREACALLPVVPVS